MLFRSQIRELGLQEFEKLVLLHVIQGGKPLVVEGWESDLPPWLYSSTWMQDNLGKKRQSARLFSVSFANMK